jgi:hypothetical protein
MKDIEQVRRHIGAFLGACKDSGMHPEDARTVLTEFLVKTDETPAAPRALEQAILELEEWFGTDMADVPTPSQSESMARVFHELKRLRAAGNASAPRPAWVQALCRELMTSKMTHNFTFSRDEVIEMLGGNLALLAGMSSAPQSNG